MLVLNWVWNFEKSFFDVGADGKVFLRFLGVELVSDGRGFRWNYEI